MIDNAQTQALMAGLRIIDRALIEQQQLTVEHHPTHTNLLDEAGKVVGRVDRAAGRE